MTVTTEVALVTSETDKKSLDDFVKKTNNGSLHQTSSWAVFQETIPGRDQTQIWVIREKKSAKILASTLCVRMDMGWLGKKWWYSPRGPVFDEKNIIHAKALIKKIRENFSKNKEIFWRIDPYLNPEKAKKFAKISPHIPFSQPTQNYQPTNTLLLDLTKTPEILLTEMKRKGRYNINLAKKHGVKISRKKADEVTKDDIDIFHKLSHETTDRNKFSGHEKSYYTKLFISLKSQAFFFTATYKETVIAAAISTICGDKAIYYFGASTSEKQFRVFMAPYLLQWEMIQFFQLQGAKTYDFLGIAPEGDDKHVYAGISEFKNKFGGHRQVYADGFEIVFYPLWYRLYRIAKWIKQKLR